MRHSSRTPRILYPHPSLLIYNVSGWEEHGRRCVRFAIVVIWRADHEINKKDEEMTDRRGAQRACGR